jgi:hypothetical protein
MVEAALISALLAPSSATTRRPIDDGSLARIGAATSSTRLASFAYLGGVALLQPANRFVDFDGDMSARAGDGANVLGRFTH